MRYKVGVRMPVDLDARMFVALEAIEWAWINVTNAWEAEHPDADLPAEPTITAWADGQHMVGSYHQWKGRAVDVRTKTLPHDALKLAFREEVAKRIGALGFDVILEDLGGPNEHLHVELDRRADQ